MVWGREHAGGSEEKMRSKGDGLGQTNGSGKHGDENETLLIGVDEEVGHSGVAVAQTKAQCIAGTLGTPDYKGLGGGKRGEVGGKGKRGRGEGG